MPDKWFPANFCPRNCTCSEEGALSPTNGHKIQKMETPPGTEDPYPAEIRMFTSDPTNDPMIYQFDWLRCDGRLFNIAQFTEVFSLIGTEYGGNGRTTFGIPHLGGSSSNYYIAMRGVTTRFTGP